MTEPQIKIVTTRLFRVNNSFSPPPGEQTIFDTKIRFGVSLPEEFLTVSYEVILTAPLPHEDRVYGEIVTENYFQIGLSSYKDGDVYRIPGAVLAPLVVIASSTARGILLGRGAGTILEAMVLPIVTVDELIEQLGETHEIRPTQVERRAAQMVEA